GQSSGGIPGALSNQPPTESDIPQVAGEATSSTVSGNFSKEATRNYELDTTISHTRQQIGVVRRVSVSVAINFKPGQTDENGQVTRVPRTE
ncbi:flagellar M-ring protein FliF C-terminal domain-containing protein, partial [Pseudomonas sp. HY7a-MNA-CIBAN-0227]